METAEQRTRELLNQLDRCWEGQTIVEDGLFRKAYSELREIYPKPAKCIRSGCNGAPECKLNTAGKHNSFAIDYYHIECSKCGIKGASFPDSHKDGQLRCGEDIAWDDWRGNNTGENP